MIGRSGLVVPVLLVALAASAVPVCAQVQVGNQGRPERPYRGLFGSGVGQTEQDLVFNASAGTSAERVNFFATSPDEVDKHPVSNSVASNWLASLAYGLNRDRVSLDASMSASTRYYTRSRDNSLSSQSARVGGSVQPWRTATVSAGLTASRQPLTVLSLLPELFGDETDPALLVDYDIAPTIDTFVAYNATLGVSQQIGRRTGLSAGAYFYRTDFPGNDRDQHIRTLYGGIFHKLTRDLELRLGYRQGRGLYKDALAGTQVYRSYNLDAGVDYSHSLSFSRRTSVRFSTGTVGVSDGMIRRFRVTGNATLVHEIGRSWSATVDYERDAGFVQTLAAPAFSDAVNVTVAGLVSRRVQVHSSLGATLGAVGIRDKDDGYRAVQGEAGVTVALHRSVGVAFTYSAYRYRFDKPDALPSSELAEGYRQSLRVNLAFWLPLFNRARVSNAAR